MPLPILQTSREPTRVDLLRHFQKTRRRLAEQLAEAEETDFGVLLANSEFSLLPESNCVLDARWDLQAISAVSDYFTQHNARCERWTLDACAPEMTLPLTQVLQQSGLVERTTRILHLKHSGRVAAADAAELQIIPARAGYRQMRELAQIVAEEARLSSPGVAQFVEAAERRLDDPHWDCLLVLRNAQAIASIAVLCVGDMGLIAGRLVRFADSTPILDRLLVSRALEVAARSMLRRVFVEVAIEETTFTAELAAFGFEEIGRAIHYEPPVSM